MADKTSVTAILLSLIALIGPNIDFSSDLDNYYICNVNTDLYGEYARLSSTSYTAYPNELDNKGRKYCKAEDGTKGTWQPLLSYTESLGIDPYSLLQQEESEDIQVIPVSSGNTIICTVNGCNEQ